MLIPQSVDPDLYDAVLSLELALGTTVPLGKDAEIFNLGPVMDISIKYQRRIKRQIGFCLQGTFGYDFMPIEAESSISLVHAGAGTGVSWQLFPRIIADASIQGGYFYSFLNDSSRIEIDNDAEVVGGNPFAAGGLGFTFLVSPAFGLGMDIYYKNYLGFLSGITMGLSASYRFIRRGDEFVRQEDIQRLQEQIREEQVPEFTGPELEFESVELAPIFPVFHKYYDDHPVGRLMLVNESTEPVEDIRLDFFVKSYMDDPKQLILPESIPPEGRQEIDLYGLFTEKILEVSEGTKVTANISVDYRLQGYQRRKELVETLRVHNRNAITWDDDRRAAAFVTAKDNAIQKFAKNTSATIISSTSRSSLKQLHTALAIYQTLSVYGLRYEIDPTTPYKDFSRDRYTLDYLQFPVQTLEYKAGDCDDLSILYNALLEAVGIETAFITIPGHIFTAFCLDINQNDAWKTFHYPDDLIFERNKIWLPVELTVLDEGFVKAWELAARQWREHTGTGRASSVDEEIFVMDSDGSNVVRITTGGSGDVDFQPAWSPDGTRLAYTRYWPNWNQDIFVIGLSESGLGKNLTNSPGGSSIYEGFPDWSPDGKQIVFMKRFGSDNWQIARLEVANPTNLTRMTNNVYSDQDPAWSPDGNLIVFYSNRGSIDTNEIYVIDADAEDNIPPEIRLTNNSAEDKWPEWSPDGSKIIFVSNRDGNNEIYTMNPDGTDQKRLTNTVAKDYCPDWR